MKQEKIYLAKIAFQNGEIINREYVRKEILDSWARSIGYGIRTDSPHIEVLTKEELQETIQNCVMFYDTAVECIRPILEFTVNSGCLLCIADGDGHLLYVEGDEEIRAIAKRNLYLCGCNLSERCLGTNAVGTAIAVKHTVEITGAEHYYGPNTSWKSCGAPVLDSEGNVCGAICLSGKFDDIGHHSLGMIAATAAAISKEMELKQKNESLYRSKENFKMIGNTLLYGVILLDKDLNIIEASERAAQLLHLDAAEIIGLNIGTIFDGEELNGWDMRSASANTNLTLAVKNEELCFAATSNRTDSGDYLLTLEPIDKPRQRESMNIGSDARFTFSSIVGNSEAISDAIHMAKIAAGSDMNVLLTGESGTGKELFAQAIHNASDRENGPFVAINCGALPKSLIESELFGYEGGSFTGAKKEGCAGKFELANGGTLFLDEIGDMPFDVQINLLRVLQNREISRIGSKKSVKINIRIISATNKNLPVAIENNLFRSDLYYRLDVFHIPIPPLREREGDVRILADFFWNKYNRNGVKLTDEIYSMLEGRKWRGNIRELENVMERTAYLAKSGIPLEKLFSFGETPYAFPEFPSTIPRAQREDAGSCKLREKDRLLRALDESEGNVTKAAESLGISRRTIYRKLDKYGIERE